MKLKSIRHIAVWLLIAIAVAVGVGVYVGQDALHTDYVPGNNGKLHEWVANTIHEDSVRLAEIDALQKEINYYMKTHSVTEKGFDIVGRFDHLLIAERDSLLFRDSVISVMWSGFETAILALGYANSTADVTQKEHLNYMGDRDILGRRAGFGVDITPGQRMRVGQWRDDKYLGERITYTDERIYGIDISRYQHEKGRKRFGINWKNLAITSLGKISKKTIEGVVNYPISFIYIKSTEGTSVRNRYFAGDYVQARKHGYKVGAYHFFSTKTSGAAQARYFCKFTKYQKGDFPPVLDVEPSYAQIRAMGGTQAMFREMRAWLKHVEAAWGVRPILYISQTFVNKYLPEAPDLLHNYNVWIARYGEYKPDVNLIYWQLCPDGRVRGIQTEVDINVFNGFKEDFSRMF